MSEVSTPQAAPRRGWWPFAKKKTAAKDKKPPFTFTDPGCRSEVRLGLLLMLAAVFLWLWLGPATSAKLYMLGIPLLAIGIPLQAWQARTDGRPGYPLKMGVILLIGGLFMMYDMTYRETVDGPLGVQPMAPLILAPGLWILAFAPLARRPRSPADTPTSAPNRGADSTSKHRELP